MRLSELITLHYRELTDNELIVCRYLLHHAGDCAIMGVSDVAQACHVSNALVTRFAQKLGFSGFSELRAHLRLEAPAHVVPARSLIAHASDSYRHVVDGVIAHDFKTTFDHLLAAERVVVFGDGAPMQNAAREAKRIFMPLVEMVEAQTPEQCKALCLSGKASFVLMLVDATDRANTTELVETLKAQGAYLFCISSMRSNESTLLADDALFVATTRVTTSQGIPFEALAPHLLALEMVFLTLRAHLSQ